MSPPPEEPAARTTGPSTVVRDAMVRFATFSVVALVVLGVSTFAFAHAIARETALREAKVRTASYAQDVIGPLVDSEARQGVGPGGVALDATLGARLQDGTLTHVLVWAQDGRIIWADDPAVTGDVLEVEEDWAYLFGTEEVVAEYTTGPEHGAFVDAGDEQVVEVYAGALDADGEPVVLEWYWSTTDLAAAEDVLLSRLLPLTLGSLVLFQLAVLPLALSLARRVQSERTRLLRHALAAQDLERRRITQDLHDGVVQDLTGVGYILPTLGTGLADGHRRLLDQVTGMVQRDIAALRVLITDLYPPDLSGAGLSSAVEALARRAGESGVQVSVSVDDDLGATTPGGRALAYRTVREGLRNVVKHSQAQHAEVSIHLHDGDVVVSLVDDGVGPGGASLDGLSRSTEDGHVGLRILADSVAETGGRLTLRPGHRSGTELVVVFPLSLAV